MSDIPKSRRSESKLEAVHKAYKLRACITQGLIQSFGYSEKLLNLQIQDKSYLTEQQRQELKDNTRKFTAWLIETERTDILNYTRGIVQHLIAANTIYPQYPSEFEERRLQMDKAMECCNNLKQELQYIVEAIPCDVNKYTKVVLEVEDEFNMIKKLRQSDNRFIKHLKHI